MQFRNVVVLACAGAAPFAAEATTVTPVEKVVDMMNGMAAKGKDEKAAEAQAHAQYVNWCSDAKTDKGRAISEASDKISKLTADIAKYVSDAEMLSKEIADHDEDISVWTGDQKAATRVREIEKGDYDATHKDYSESIDALTRAIQVVKDQAKDQAQSAASFVQLASLKRLRNMDDEAQRTIDAFLAMQEAHPHNALAMSALQQSQPAAAGYEAQSHGVIEMLVKMQEKFEAERTDLENAERDSKQAYDVLIQDLDSEIAAAKDAKSKKTETKAKKLEDKADAEGEAEDTTATMNADQQYLDEVSATCAQKQSDFDARQKLRGEEIVALEKAIEIISSDEVAGAAGKHLPALVQAPSLSQLRSEAAMGAAEEARARTRLTSYLQGRAAKFNSRVLSMVAARAMGDPFAKVKKMIQDMITKLMEQANEEAGHKAWCDSELGSNEQTRKEKTAAVEMLHADVDALNVDIATLADELSALNGAIASLDAAMGDATKLRAEEKAKNTETVDDATAAQAAVAQALGVLKEFYAKAGDQSMATESDGVLGMLEVIASDFARLESETSASDETAQKEYDAFMKTSIADKESKQADIEHKTAKKQDKSQALVVSKEDLEATQTELNAALSYFDELKPSCVDMGLSYEDRVARREEEIESLQGALKMLE